MDERNDPSAVSSALTKLKWSGLKMLGVLAVLGIAYFFVSYGCHAASQWWTRSFGGTMNVTIASGQKLVNASWKGNSLWILTRPMHENERPETYEYQEDSTFGVLEGKVVINESSSKKK